MAKVVIEIPDHYVNWAQWAQDELNKGGVTLKPGSKESPAPESGPTQSYQGGPESPPVPYTGGVESASQGDPWAGTDTQVAPPRNQQPTGTTIQGKNGPIQVTFNAGPACGCGMQSALYTGFTNGKQWRAYRCARGAGPGDSWKNKCDFQQWA